LFTQDNDKRKISSEKKESILIDIQYKGWMKRWDRKELIGASYMDNYASYLFKGKQPFQKKTYYLTKFKKNSELKKE
jgi:hypothetical protein